MVITNIWLPWKKPAGKVFCDMLDADSKPSISCYNLDGGTDEGSGPYPGE